MAKYDKGFLIEIRPTLTKDSIQDMKKEVTQLTKTIKDETKLTYDLDIKKESRVKMKQLKKEIEEITGLAKISSKTNLGKLDLNSEDLNKASKKLKEYTILAKESSSTRIDANYGEFEKVLKKVEQLNTVFKKMEQLDPSNAEDIKKGKVLLEEYEKTAQSIARLGYDKNAFTTSLRERLEVQNTERQKPQDTNVITKEMKQLTNEAFKSKKGVISLNEEIKDLGTGNTVKKLKTDTDKVTNSMNQATVSTKKVQDATKNPKGNKNLKDTKKTTDGLVESFKKMGRWSVVAFAWREFAQQIRTGIQYLKELDVILTEISVVTGKSRQQVAALSKEFNTMASKLGRTTAEVARASKIFFRQGKTTEEVMKLVEATTIAASVAHIDLAEASDYLTSTLNGFQMEATQAMEIVDKFSAVGANAGTSFEEMAQALKKVAASANNANVDIDHMISYLATVSEVTREAPENIGTSFKTLFARMQKIKDGDMPKELNEVDTALQSIGISLVDEAGQIDSLQIIVEKLGSKWDTLTKNQQAYIATSIAGTRQQVRFISLMDNYGRSVEILEESLESTGEAQLQFGQYLGGVEAHLKEFKAAIENLYSSIVDTEEINDFIDILIDLTFRLQSLIHDFGVLGTVALGFGAIVGGKLLWSSISLLGGFSKVSAAIALVKKDMVAATTAVDTFAVATKGAKTVVASFRAV